MLRSPRGLGSTMVVFVEVFVYLENKNGDHVHVDSASAGYNDVTAGGRSTSRLHPPPIWGTPSLKSQTCRRRLTDRSVRELDKFQSVQAGTVEPYEGKLRRQALLHLKARIVKIRYKKRKNTDIDFLKVNNKIRTVHHRMLLRIICVWCRSSHNHFLSYNDALQRTKCKASYSGAMCFCATETTGYQGGSCQEGWRTGQRGLWGGGKGNGRTAWQMILGCLGS